MRKGKESRMPLTKLLVSSDLITYKMPVPFIPFFELCSHFI
jgi:hypothetical protein